MEEILNIVDFNIAILLTNWKIRNRNFVQIIYVQIYFFDMNSNIKFPLNASNSFIEKIIIDTYCV